MKGIRSYVADLVGGGAFRRHAADLASAERRIRTIAKHIGGNVGFAAIHIESDQILSVNGSRPLPMASTVKLPIAVQVMKRLERGELALDALVSIESRHVCPGGGTLAGLRIPGVAVSIENLLDLALVRSDNTASAALLELAGGATAVVDLMNTIGIGGINIHRSVRQLLIDYYGLTEDEAKEDAKARQLGLLPAAIPAPRRAAAAAAFLRDARDQSPAMSMASLVAAVWNRRVLEAAQTAVLFDTMARCCTGRKRLKGLLPAGTRVAHKTGTLPPSMVADVGIIYLPPPFGHCAVAAVIAESGQPMRVQSKGIARMARVVYDLWVSQRV
ncbi:MAG TPA: serine hydrolase [Vicinamibacterales bacterium]|nr:serine hydrolase [Vicinamibacterales bacterium]